MEIFERSARQVGLHGGDKRGPLVERRGEWKLMKGAALEVDDGNLAVLHWNLLMQETYHVKMSPTYTAGRK